MYEPSRIHPKLLITTLLLFDISLAVKGHMYTDQLDYMYKYMKTTHRLLYAIFIDTCTCQTEVPKMYALLSKLIYPITHSTVRLTCDSSILIYSNEQQHMYHVYLSPPRNELDQETDMDT